MVGESFHHMVAGVRTVTIFRKGATAQKLWRLFAFLKHRAVSAAEKITGTKKSYGPQVATLHCFLVPSDDVEQSPE